MTSDSERGAAMPRRIEVIARGVAIRDGSVLLCEDRQGGYCYLPGGHVEPGESAAAAVAREVMEEAGWIAGVGALLFAAEQRFDQASRKTPGRRVTKHEITLVFLIESLERGGSADGGGAGDGAEGVLPAIESREAHLAFRWVDLAAAVDLDIRPSSVRAWLAGGASDVTC